MKVTKLLILFTVIGLTAATGCVTPTGYNLPPASRLLEPGPGVGGPGPGVIPPPGVNGASPAAPGVSEGQLSGTANGGLCDVGQACRACSGEIGDGGVSQVGYTGPTCMSGGAVQRTVQVLFAAPESMEVRWDVTGQNNFDSEPLVVPGHQNFSQSGVYRLKLTNIQGFEGVELYPTLEVGPVTPRTRSFLAHSSIPVQVTQEDFAQVMAGNQVVKVIYLPDPEFQVLSVAGSVGTLVSTKLDPGQDPIVEADQRGAIMAILRIGNLDIESLASAGEPAYIGGGFQGGGAVAGGLPGQPGSLAPGSHIAGVTTVNYGMPYTGTPIGLPGPMHLPLGHEAGLRSHVMHNHTPYHMPRVPQTVGIHVTQQPGYSYPAPANRVRIREQVLHPSQNYRQPSYSRNMLLK